MLARLVGLLGLLGCTTAVAEPPALSLDEALTTLLALGEPGGCGTDFTGTVPGTLTHDEYIGKLRDDRQLANALAAICGSSAVQSAAALGGSLGSMQTTKTVSQFRLARNQIDIRQRQRGKRFGLSNFADLANRDSPSKPVVIDAQRGNLQALNGIGFFVQGEIERRDRETTVLEAGYEGNVSQGLIGLDYLTKDGSLLGAWSSYSAVNAEYVGVKLTVKREGSEFSRDISPALLSDMCKISPGGKFSDDGTTVGAFFGQRYGSVFADVAARVSDRNYEMQRNVCTIEPHDPNLPITRDGETFLNGDSVDKIVDDIYAGTIFGRTRLNEWSVSTRAGFDFGQDRFLLSPRVSITYTKTTIAAFSETGQASVANEVNSVGGLKTTRNLGDPIGLELVFDEQTRASLQTEAQFVIGYRFTLAFGELIPRVSAAWIHEFQGERQLVTVHMAQDLRSSPKRFEFTADSTDKNKGTVAIGATFLVGTQFTADFAITSLVADSNFSSTTVTAQARWQF